MPKTARDFFNEWAGADGAADHHTVGRDLLRATIQAMKDHPDIKQDEIRQHYARFDPRHSLFSNHAGCGFIVFDRMLRNSNWIEPSFFKNIFVGVVKENSIHAVAVEKSDEFTGKLIVYYWGLLQAVIFVADCFEHYIFNRDELNDDILNAFFSDICTIFEKWRSEDHYGDPSDVAPLYDKYQILGGMLANTIAGHSDAFIIGHEIAHHFLGDTQHFPIAPEEMHALERSIGYMRFSEECATEGLADLLSLHLAIGSPNDFMRYDHHEVFCAILGGMNALQVITLMSNNPLEASGDDPPAGSRFELFWSVCGAISMGSFFSNPETATGAIAVKRALKDYRDFSDMLIRSRLERGEVH